MRLFNLCVVACALFMLAAAPPRADAALVAGLTVRELAPAEFANSTVLSVNADPAGVLWYSNGFRLFTAPGDGSPASSESLRIADGGPIGPNQVTTDVAFDSAGRIYISDFGTGQIFRRVNPGGPWEVFATGPALPRAMKFDANGDLIVAAGNIADVQGLGSFTRISPAGVSTTIAGGLARVEAFDFDAPGGTGDLVFPDYISGEIFRVDPVSGVATLIGNGRAGAGLVEAFAITDGGLMLLGVNTSTIFGNANRLDRFDPSTGESIVLGRNFTDPSGSGFRLPVDFVLTDRLLIAAFGSIQPLDVVGNLDADFGGGLDAAVNGIPEPASLFSIAIVFGLAGGLIGRRRASR